MLVFLLLLKICEETLQKWILEVALHMEMSIIYNNTDYIRCVTSPCKHLLKTVVYSRKYVFIFLITEIIKTNPSELDFLIPFKYANVNCLL